jgi:hypothetical protein
MMGNAVRASTPTAYSSAAKGNNHERPLALTLHEMEMEKAIEEEEQKGFNVGKLDFSRETRAASAQKTRM